MNQPAAVPGPTHRPSQLGLHPGATAPEHNNTSMLNSDEASAGAPGALRRAASLTSDARQRRRRQNSATMIAVYVIVVLVLLLLLLLGLALSVRIIKQYERVVLFEVGQGQGQNGQRLPS
jgi:hypothetical protein